MDLIFNEKECQVLNFTDMTTYLQLKCEEEKNKLLSTLNMSVHHEMLVPLKVNVDASSHLIKHLNRQNSNAHTRKMARTILVSSKLLLLHAHDLLDSRFI